MKKLELNNVKMNMKKTLEIEYKILNPGGNKTAIVMGNNYTKEEKKEINDLILKEDLEVEQVGFISKKENSLEMAGGEFCVNATRCAIWEYLGGKQGEIEIKVSSCDSKIKGGITKEKEVYAEIQINKTLNEIIEKRGIFSLIKLEGILLLVVDEDNSKKYIKKLKINELQAKKEFKEIIKKFDIDEKAVGIILLEREENKIKINPVIWVKTIDTLYYETACGSGSLATTIYKNYSEGIENLEILQPSGYSIKIKLDLNKEKNYIREATILGKVIEEE